MKNTDNTLENYQGILAFCETANRKLTPLAAEVLGAGSQLSRDLGQNLSALLVGDGVSSAAPEALAYGAATVYVVESPYLKNCSNETYLQILAKIVSDLAPEIVLLGQNEVGRDLAPALAFRLKTAATLDCIALTIDAATRRMLMTKPVFGGNALAVQTCDLNPQIATLRTKAFSSLVKDPNRQGEIVNLAVTFDPASSRTRLLAKETEAAAGIKLAEAKVIVAGGRGIGGSEGFKQLAELAEVLAGAVGATRPSCDNQWISDNLQIGLTGKVVSPELYIAVAVSGSSQHLSGCSGARVMVAINKDAEANIFKYANYGLVADWQKVFPAFLAEVKRLIT